jgi:membrane protein
VATVKMAVGIAKETFRDFFEDEITWKAAALSYFTVFAIAPLLLILLQVASFIWDPAQVRDALTGQFSALMGQDVARQVETMMASAEEKTASGSGARLALSIAGLLFGATGAFVALQTALNRAWEVEPDPRRGGIKNFITKRFLSLGMVLGIAFLLLVSLAATAALSAVGDAVFGGLGDTFAKTLDFVLTFAVISVLFAAMFKVLPDAKVSWRDVWVGAVATAFLFVIGKFLIGLYIGQSDPGSTFGAAGALAVLLVWIYYAAVILLLGAEFTQAWMKFHGREIEPEEGAVRIVETKERLREAGDGSGKERTPAMASTRHAEADPALSRGKGSEKSNEVRREITQTRERLSGTVAAIESRVSNAVSDVKEKADVSKLVQDHPWSALAAALVAGAAVSATRADAKAADVAAEGVKRAASAAGDGLARVVEPRTRELGQELRRAADDMRG